MKITSKGRKKFSKEEKLKILKEGKQNGVRATLKKYALYPATYYYWNRKYESMGSEGMDHGMTRERLRRIKQLEKENETLKQIIAEKELESKLKDELLKKKKYPHLRRSI